jgi:hypothetical protein
MELRSCEDMLYDIIKYKEGKDVALVFGNPDNTSRAFLCLRGEGGFG